MEKDQERCVSFLLDLVDANGRLVSDVPPRVATLTVPAPLMELKEGYKLYATGEKSASAILWSSLQDEFRTAFSSYYDLPDPLVILYNGIHFLYFNLLVFLLSSKIQSLQMDQI